MDDKNKIGCIEALVDNANGQFGVKITGQYIQMDGLIITTIHPSRITVSDSTIDFTYTVGSETVVRSYGLTRSDGKITSVAFPDGHSLEVLRNG